MTDPFTADGRYLEKAEATLRRAQTDLDLDQVQRLAILSIATSLVEISERLALLIADKPGYRIEIPNDEALRQTLADREADLAKLREQLAGGAS